MLSGFVHLWLFDVAAVPPPSEIDGRHIGAPPEATTSEQHSHGAPTASTWFQGHILTVSADTQYTLTGVPALHPPPIHGCMVSEHDTPTYYDIYISEYHADGPVVKYCAINVERSGGSGDAVELRLEDGSQVERCPNAHMAKQLKLSTTKMVTGERARSHLEKYAPDALSTYTDIAGGSDSMVVCLGVISLG
ncbi:hypothetical protein GGI03_006876 [Coemansia sp. RSA 2337]|nr:hypothetical protein GGI14_004120 [Coemansia sp. S680]KAJ2077123.1 hypothetical protein GGI16_008202 [Coemansia sp. S142-1]KAJ2096225.1 hypothetical protein GGI09_004463 [Coemansia sp. S100]KAJ2097350.1 hypothetical protein IW146_010205 [Coemansia sp. RSA 922]KAJ2451424.1 hypothetical protein GGI03_006876 [Coemansia sp. RSA 2337]